MMKRKWAFLGMMCAWLGIASVSAQEVSIIEGKWLTPSKADTSLNLYKIENGEQQMLASSNLTADGRFGFAFYPEKEGYYVVGKNERSRVNRYVFYFKPGDDVQFEIDGDNWKLVGENTPENQTLAQWHETVYPLEAKAVYFMKKRSTFVDYFPQLEQLLPIIEAYPKAVTSNRAFNESFEYFKKYNFIEINLSLLSTPRAAHPKNTDFIDYYRQIDLVDLTASDALLDYPYAMWLIEAAYWCSLRSDVNLSQEEAINRRRNMKSYLLGKDSPIKNARVKGELILYYAGFVKDYAGIDQFRENYAQYLVTDSQKSRFNQIVGKLDDHSQGHEAIDFKFPDINGKEVALSDFKGKVVYIDIWATWCGPCKMEIPHMGKLEEEFKDNPDMVFMSVSIDAAKDQQKWKDMVGEKQMKGIQLFAGSKSDDIAKPYKVRGIPRFILVGKDGKLISGNAPRPSSADIRPLLRKALAK